MSSYLSFSYQKLKKLPNTTQEEQEQEHLGVVSKKRTLWRRRWSFRRDSGGHRRRPRLRISRLTRVLRRKLALVGDKVRLSVTKVVRRLKEGRPYIDDLFAGNYMFLQVAPSPTMGSFDKGYYGNTMGLHPGVMYKV